MYPEKVILLNGGSFNPLHWGHVEALDDAAEICKQLGIQVVGKIISPNNQSYLRGKLYGKEPPPVEDRLRYIQHARKFRPDVDLETHAIDNDKGQHISRDQVVQAIRAKYPGVEPVIVEGDDVGGQPGLRKVGNTWYCTTSRDKGTGSAGQSSTAVRKRKQQGLPPLPFEIDPDVPTHLPPPSIQKYMNPSQLRMLGIKQPTANVKIDRDMWLKIGQQAGWIKRAYGGVVFNSEGKVLIVEPLDHFDDTVWTWPKGKADPNETPESCALREVREETGVPVSIVSKLPGSYKGSTSITEYFLMRCMEQEEHGQHDDETASTKWVTPQEAAKFISMTPKASAKQRDLAVLSAAASLIPKPKIQPQPIQADPTKPQVDPTEVISDSGLLEMPNAVKPNRISPLQ